MAPALRAELEFVRTGLVGALVTVLWVVLSLLMSGEANAWTCMPKPVPNGTGSSARSVITLPGQCLVWWCGAPDPADSTKWLWHVESQCGLTRYLLTGVADLVDVVANSDDPLTTANTLDTGLRKAPANAAEKCQLAALRYKACQRAIEPPLLVPGLVLAANACGAAPPACSTHYVKPNPASTAIPPTRPVRELVAGVLGKTLGAVTVDTPCDLSHSTIKSGTGGDLWASPAGYPDGQVALCWAPK